MGKLQPATGSAGCLMVRVLWWLFLHTLYGFFFFSSCCCVDSQCSLLFVFIRTSVEKSTPGSDTWKILAVELDRYDKRSKYYTLWNEVNHIQIWNVFCRLDQQLKKLDNGQTRWSPDSNMYLTYIREIQNKRRKDLLLSMHGKCSERWFLLQLMKKYAGYLTYTFNVIS